MQEGSSSRAYSYDNRGNVTGDGIHGFSYDFANQPISINGLDTGSFVYDGNYKRCKQVIDGKTIYSFYDSSGVLLTRDEITGTNTHQVTDLIAFGGQTFVRVTDGVASYPLNDHLGTSYMVADQNGNITAANTFNYTPFGEPIGNDPGAQNRQGFTGHVADETKLIYMQARYYDPTIGRFLSGDPIGYADQLNLYAYAYNDPVNRTDPWGLWTCDIQNQEEQCMQIAVGIGKARRALDTMTDLNQRLRLQEVLRLWGKFGDPGINVKFASLPPYNPAHAGLTKDLKSVDITVDAAQMKKMSPIERAGKIIGHEGLHGVDDLAKVAQTGGSAATLSEQYVYGKEHRAYELTSAMDEALGNESNLWRPGMSNREREIAVNHLAHESYLEDCAAWNAVQCTAP